jgi:NADH-quinone oxidoreductase subunit J
MVLEQLAFGLFALVTVASSLGVVLARDVWHAALLLGVALSSVAIHYVMLAAEFVAVMQVLVYIGGVLVLITFGVMLTRESDTEEPGSLSPEDEPAATGEGQP